MPLGILLVNVVSASTSIGALTALVVLFLHLRSRGVLLLALAVLFLTMDFSLGLVLFASPDTPLWNGLSGVAAGTRHDAVLLGLKGLLQVGVLLTGPLAVLSLFGRTPPRTAVGAGAFAALAALGASACLLGGFLPGAWGALSFVSISPGYLAFAACFAVLLGSRKSVPPGLSRGIVRAAIGVFSVCLPVLLASDVLSLAGARPVLLPADALAFLALSGGALVCTLLVLLSDGLRYKQIADRLGISLDTVKSHVSSVYRKSEAAGRTDLLYKIRLGRL